MANWQGAILTDKGRILQAKVEGGLCQLALTKLKTGDGTLAPGQTLEALTDLVSPKQNIGITGISIDDDQPGVVYIKGILSNADLDTGYLVKELGLFATDPDDGEILYAVTVDPNPDYLQDKTSATIITEALKLAIAISNTSDVVPVIDPDGLWTVRDMQEWIAAHDFEIGTVELENTLKFPFNNSKQSVSLTRTRSDTNYVVLTEVTAFDGNVGEVEVSGKLSNGFQIGYTGSASSVTVKYYVMGGLA